MGYQALLINSTRLQDFAGKHQRLFRNARGGQVCQGFRVIVRDTLEFNMPLFQNGITGGGNPISRLANAAGINDSQAMALDFEGDVGMTNQQDIRLKIACRFLPAGDIG